MAPAHATSLAEDRIPVSRKPARPRRTALLAAVLAALVAAPTAHAAGWVVDGVALTLDPAEQTAPLAASDGEGGAYVVWLDARSGNADLYAQHVTSAGNLTGGWPANGLAVCTDPTTQQTPAICADGAGGAYVVWMDTRNGTADIFALRLVSAGVAPGWPANGIAVCTAPGTQENPSVCTDGGTGALVAWSDVRGLSEDIYVTHLLQGGTVDPLWTPQGNLLCNAAQQQQFPAIVPDGAGGAVVAWDDHRNGGALSPQQDIYAGHMTAVGAPDTTWAANGVALCVVAGSDQDDPQAVSDGAGGAYVCWQDDRNGTFSVPDQDIYTTHVRANGTIPAGWGATGLPTARVGGLQSLPVLVADGAGGVIIAWQDGRDTSTFPTNTDIYAQHFLASGALAAGWAANGNDLTSQTSRQDAPAIATDGNGGALVTWTDQRFGADIYAQHVHGDGTLASGWPTSGIAISTAANSQIASTLVTDGAGGAVCAWQDNRSGAGNDDVYAQRFYGSGQVGPTVGVPALPPTGALMLAPAGEQPARGVARFTLRLAAASTVTARVYDVRGRAVATLLARAAVPAGTTQLTWDGRTDRGARAASGVYHLAVAAGDAHAAIRFVDLP
jgi:hypothetical protein